MVAMLHSKDFPTLPTLDARLFLISAQRGRRWARLRISRMPADVRPRRVSSQWEGGSWKEDPHHAAVVAWSR